MKKRQRSGLRSKGKKEESAGVGVTGNEDTGEFALPIKHRGWSYGLDRRIIFAQDHSSGTRLSYQVQHSNRSFCRRDVLALQSVGGLYRCEALILRRSPRSRAPPA